MTDHHPVLIAGGGPSGLAAAIELGRAGIRCAVVEPRVSVATDRPRAKTTSARTMELLRRWGLADRVRAAAPLPVAHAQDVVFCTRLTGHEITRFPNAFALHPQRRDEFAECGQQIPQPVVEEVLRAAVAELPTVEFLAGHRLVAAEDGPDGLRARIAGPDDSVREVTAGYLLGCDGATGASRDAIGARYAGGSGALPNLNVTFRAPELTEERVCARAVHYWVLGAEVGGIVGRMDLDGTWWAIAQGVDASAADVDPAALVRSMVGTDDTGADIDVEVLATDPWTARMLLVDRYRGDRTFLVGDAAHLNPPWGGHGYNTCVGDAVNIAWKLVAVLQGWAGPALLDSYEPERRPVAAQTIADAAAQESRLAHAFRRAELDADTPAGAACRAGVAEALAVKRGEFHSLGLVLGYHYADSPVVVDDGSPVPAHDPLTYHASARPGARLPHAWLADGSSLYDHLATAGFTLLRREPGIDVAPFRAAADRHGVPFALLDLPGLPGGYDAPLLLVRPDQHVAWRGADARDAAGVLDVARGAVRAALPS
ncbi:FAD-dependent monooxygenase [Pseudonocardia kunmingensis]|uniref:2-polyprenyl-6-methoxyphenol hydroxylase-like FAD-dependent oxidoreductase n=1 Tax=Pseudonocardia kunmingensis TaxID=630975 RepID=A0A543D0W6_9PSEU|nr:FAD-dependent monooxygenase [Pseudonocardia kunmingensis]TQM02996.1 2-polyprenyl-6-methoxyphenol hydroxylase-like FAD-dependent oxidoreductase [Pseudonocardia kunmingensis]